MKKRKKNGFSVKESDSHFLAPTESTTNTIDPITSNDKEYLKTDDIRQVISKIQ